jgi:hypothetical protein
VLARINTKIEWTTLNRKNLTLLMIMTLVGKEPYRIKFSDNIVINYEFGVKVSSMSVIFFFKVRSFSACQVGVFLCMFFRTDEKFFLLNKPSHHLNYFATLRIKTLTNELDTLQKGYAELFNKYINLNNNNINYL